MKTIKKIWHCYIFGSHEWTSPIQEGVPVRVPEKGATMQEVKQCLYESSRMYCKRCGYESELSKRILK